MENYKSPLNRLAHLFKKGRDVWKERAIKKQKRIKTLEIKVRDLSLSRDNWKHRAKTAEKNLNQVEKKLLNFENEVSQPPLTTNNHVEILHEVIPAQKFPMRVPGFQTSTEGRVVCLGDFIPADECVTQIPARHYYPVLVIQYAQEQFLKSLNSFRGCQSTFDVFAQFFSLPVPSFSSIRNWLLRAGLYELQKIPKKRTDWIFLIDMTIQLGNAKCYRG